MHICNPYWHREDWLIPNTAGSKGTAPGISQYRLASYVVMFGLIQMEFVCSADLMKSAPDLMTKALNLHNAAIRKARWQNYGHTIEQEGDSYTIVFHDAIDAVMFCLQTQLLLQRQPWPEGLMPHSAAQSETAKRRSAGQSLV